MSFQIKFRNNWPPLIQKPVLSKEKDFPKNKSSLKKNQNLHNNNNTVNIQEILKEINELVGLDTIKKLFTNYMLLLKSKKNVKRKTLLRNLWFYIWFSAEIPVLAKQLWQD